MKCRICARECPPGAKICRDCAAARKRAFAATVTQPLLAAAGAPSVGRPRFAPRPAKPRLARRAAAAMSPRSEAAIAASSADHKAASPSRLDVRWLLLGLAVVAAIVYLLLRTLTPSHGHSTDDAVTSGDSAHVAPSKLAPVVPTSAVATEDEAAHGAAQARARPDVKDDSSVALKNAIPKAGARKGAGKIEAVKTPPAAPVTPPEPQPVQVAQAPPPRVAEAPRDPWQVMNEGLSRCAREDWFSRGACEQRLRLQYCPNNWGLVPQCPIGPTTDHGQ